MGVLVNFSNAIIPITHRTARYNTHNQGIRWPLQSSLLKRENTGLRLANPAPGILLYSSPSKESTSAIHDSFSEHENWSSHHSRGDDQWLRQSSRTLQKHPLPAHQRSSRDLPGLDVGEYTDGPGVNYCWAFLKVWSGRITPPVYPERF